MKEYHRILKTILETGKNQPTRAVLKSTGQKVGAITTIGRAFRFDLSEGFPAVTGKKLFMKGVVKELLWFLRGSTNANELIQDDVHIWDEWVDEAGELGPIYGFQWIRWGEKRDPEGNLIEPGINQIKNVIEQIQKSPDSRRLIVSAWNVADLSKMHLPPCHLLFQFHVLEGKLHCTLTQRSADAFLGVPFNIASYALLTHMIAQVTGLQVGELVIFFGNLHIYDNHTKQVDLYLSRSTFPLPKLNMNPDVKDIFSFRYEDFQLEGYQSHPHIKAEVAV